MKKFVSIVIAALSLLVLGGCATVSTLPSVDVSKMPNKTLTGAEIDVAVRGKQINIEVRRTNGSSLKVLYVFESNNTVNGVWLNETDKGPWQIDQQKGQLCFTFSRWGGGCATANVYDGKLHLQRADNGTKYIQQ